MSKAVKILQEVLKKAKAPERYKGSFYPGGHGFSKKCEVKLMIGLQMAKIG